MDGSKRLERRLAAIFAADVAGYSRLMSEDEVGTLRALTAHREIMDALIAEHGGRIANTAGDSVLAEFPSAVDAVQCAVAIQERLAVTNATVPQESRFQFRIGIHLGDVVVRGGDLLGDGVNIAARLEGLAEPGGVCISAAVHSFVRKALPLTYANLGEQKIKNIDEPIIAYAVGHQAKPSVLAESTAPLPLPDKPSIAVLPFINMSGNPEQEYLADGLVEDIIIALSRVKSFFVIARNSSFSYKGRSIDVRQVGRELGVRYILEGSVRSSGTRIRITGQLVEAEAGRHVWSDRFDGDRSDIFDLQDRVTESVAAVIEQGVSAAEIARATAKPTDNLDAYDLYLRALPFHYSMSKEGFAEAHDLLKRAVQIDPSYSRAKAFDAFTYVVEVAQGWGGDAERSEGTRLAKEAIAANRDDPVTLRCAGHALAFLGGEFEMAGVALERAIMLNPNSAQVQSAAGWVNMYLGRAEAAIENFTRAMRLSPLDPEMGYMLSGVANAYHYLGQYERTVEFAERAVREMPNWIQAHLFWASALAGLDRTDEARSVMQNIFKLLPGFTATAFLRLLAQPNPELRLRYVSNLIKAGLPDDRT